MRARASCTAAGCIVLAMLAGCGFRLAGSYRLPAVLARPYLSIANPYTDFAREMQVQLRAAGAAVQIDGNAASATIDISRDSVEQRTLSVSSRNIPTEYELVYVVTFSVRGPDRELLPPQTIDLARDFSFEEPVLLAKDHEADVLRAQMARDLAAIAMRRLTRLK